MLHHRDDIDGLRAISIAAVVLFHAGFDDWKGGYLGVDIFFVISGYLITAMITREMEEGRFSLWGFYERRARRLLAATIPVVLFTTLLAWAFYTTDLFLAYAKSLVAFAAYASNWFFLASTGYFGNPPDTTPLLHTWSLAVEEQFYFVFPALLLLLGRHKSAIVPVLAVLAALSLAYAQAELSAGNDDRAFFSLLSRFWELMAGALLALRAKDAERLARFSTPMRVAGLAMIVGAILTFNEETQVPGLPTLLPVLGTLLVLAASPAVQDPILKVLAANPVTYLGRISYSLYLWHWPILGAMRTIFLDRNDLHLTLAILTSIAVAALSYHYVEQPVRQRRVLPRKIDMAGLVAATLLVTVSVGAYGWTTGGWPGRFDPAVERMAAEAAIRPEDPDNCFKTGSEANDFCTLNTAPGQPIDLLLWGDSHAGSLIQPFQKYAQERGLSLAIAARGDCLPLLGVWRTKDPTQVCRRFNDDTRAFIEAHRVRNVAIAARWQVYTSGPQLLLDDAHPSPSRSTVRTVLSGALDRTFESLSGRNVMIVEQVPELRSTLPASYLLMHRLGRPAATVGVTLDQHRKKSRTMSEALAAQEAKHRFARLDPAAALFCKGELCAFEADGKLLYFDDDHLNAAGGLFLYPALAEAMDAWRAQDSAAKQADRAPAGTP